MIMDYQVYGLKELDRKLRNLPQKVARRVLKQALRKAMKPVLADARNLAPRLTGALARSIKIRSGRSRNRNETMMRVTQSAKDLATKIESDYQGDYFYGAFQEFGTEHQAARPFLRPALERNRDRVLSVLRAEIGAGIEREAAKG